MARRRGQENAKVRVAKRKRSSREDERKERVLSAHSNEKASVQRQGANEIVGYVLSTAA